MLVNNGGIRPHRYPAFLGRSMNSDPLRGFAPQIPQIFSQQWGQILAMLQPAAAASPAAEPAPAAPALQFDPQKLQQLQQHYQRELTRIMSHASEPAAQVLKDKRFAAESWRQQPGAAMMAQVYLLNSQTLTGLADAVKADEKTTRRIRFAVEQWAAALSPSNCLAFNPEAQQKLIASQGASLAKGISNLLHDMQQGQYLAPLLTENLRALRGEAAAWVRLHAASRTGGMTVRPVATIVVQQRLRWQCTCICFS